MTEQLHKDTLVSNSDNLDEEVFVFPVSFAQQRLWFFDQFEPGSPAYNIPTAVRLRGPLNIEVFERTLREIVRRHETLRTTFEAIDGQPMQVISPRVTLSLDKVDLRHLPAQKREAEALRLVEAEAQRPFSLTQGPLFRAHLFRLDDQEYIVLLNAHHIISDGWSMGVLVNEITTIYSAFAAHRPSPLPELPIQYADFAHWQRQWLQGEVLQSQIDYWKKQLGGSNPVLDLPTDRPRPAVWTSRGASLSTTIPKALTEQLKALSQREGATLFMTLLAAFQVLLYRYTGQEDISVGTPIANRNRAEIEGLIGFFVNTLVMRTDLSGNPSFRELLGRVRETALGAYAHQDLPFEMLVEQLQPTRDMSHMPLFQVMFILQNAPARAQELAGLSLELLETHSGTSTFDLTLSMSETFDGLSASMEFNTDLFNPDTIRRMLGHFQTLLESIVADPSQSISTLRILTEDERQQLAAWNDTALDCPTDLCAHQLFEMQVARTPEAIAVSCQGEHLSYRELNRRANQLAHYLIARGIGPDMLVGLFLERSVQALVAVLGVLKAGGAYLPLDPNAPRERLGFILQDARVAVLLTQQTMASSLPPTDAEVLCLDADWPTIARYSDQNPAPPVSPQNLAYVIYTSGSTGQPKGVMVCHRNLVNAYFAWEKAYGLRSDVSCHLQMANISFDVFTGDMVRALGSGGRLVLCPREFLLDPPKLYKLMRDEQVDCAEFVPVVLRQLVQYLEQTQQRLDFMRLLICGSDNWYVGEFKQCRRLCGAQTRLVNSFGLTETTIDSSYFEGTVEALSDDQIVPIGRPFGNTQLYVLDAHQQLLPIGVPGELYIGGAGLARGYFGRPDLTAERYIPSPFDPGERLYKTGDLARFLPDGNLQFLGRADNQVKIRGFRIELGEIEAVLGQHPAIKDAVVLAREDSPGDKRLAAYVIPLDGQLPSSSELRRFVQERLPDYMVPSVFVELQAFPLTPSGKVDRLALPKPDWSQRASDATFAPPRTPTEELMAQIWAELLGLERVGIYDNFFELGGHSLLATQVVSRLRDALGVELPLRALFEAPTIATLAERAEIAQRAEQGLHAPPIVPVPREGELPLSFAQQRLWFLDQLEPNSPFYNMPDIFRLKGALDVGILQRALNALVERHEILRTNFASIEGRAVQVIAPQREIPIVLTDLRHLPPAQREAEAQRLTNQDAQRPFDLARDALLRVRLIRLDAEDYLVVIIAHHIISDDWSSNVMMREIAALYEAFSRGQPSPLPALPIQYADFAHWQRNWLQGEVLERQLAYWKERLAGAPPLLELPTDRPRPSVQTFNGAYQTFRLPDDLARALRQLCQQEGVTLFMALLAAFQALLYRYTGQEDICIGTPIANRNRREIEGLIGFFVNTLVLRTDLSGQPSFRELLKRVREVALGAYAHQDLPFEMLVDALQPERNLSHSPLFQVMFVIQNAQLQRGVELPGLSLTPAEIHSGTAKFDLTLFISESPEQIGGAVEYNTDLFNAATIARLIGHLNTLIEGIVRNPDQSIAALPILTEPERHQLLHTWNDTRTDPPERRCAHQLFEAQAARTPDALALTFQGNHLTYRQLDQRANQLAHYLIAQGIGPDVLVGLCVERSLELGVGLLGILKAGGAYLPLDPTYPPERLAFMLQDAQVPILLTQKRLLGRLPAQGLRVICLDADWPAIAEQSTDNPRAPVSPEHLAYVIYTSGSTGLPKGAMILHRGLSNYLDWCLRAYPLREGQGAPVHSSISFDLTVTSLLGPLVSGGRVYLLPEELGVEALGTALSEERDFSLVKITPAHLEILSQQLGAQRAAGRTRAFIIGGENLLADSLSFWRDHAPETMLVNEYGPTETVVGCCVHAVEADDPRSGSVHIGRPIINTQLYILDRNLQPVPVGVVGELYIGGLGVARGYLNRPELTAERFIPDPFSSEPEARLYKTGDLARYRPDGNIEFLGRSDNQVKIRGFRVELGEVEAVLSSLPGVKEVVVLAREDVPGHRRLVAYLVPQQAAKLDAQQISAELGKRLPEYMIPSAFVFLEALPLTPNGKVDRRALPAPESAKAETAHEHVPPRNAREQLLADIWAQLLGLDKVGVFDSFFELGGDSILSIQVIARAKQAGLHLTPKQIFQHPTIAELAAVAGTGERIEAQQDAVTGPAPLTPIQHWFFEQGFPEPHHWNQALLLELHHPLDKDVLEKALQHLLIHHDALRLRFTRDGGTWEQRHAGVDECHVPLTWADLSKLKESAQAVEIEKQCTSIQASFDLAKGPLLRAAVFALGPKRGYRLFLAAHHLVMDGVSWRILLEDLQAAYQQLVSNKPVQLPPKTTSFQYWAKKLSEYAQTDEVLKELDYWLAMAKQTAPLPVDMPRGENSEASAREVTVSLTEDETEDLLHEVPLIYHTEINDVLLAAVTLAFIQWTGASGITINLEGHGREPLFDEVDLSRTIGWFTTLYPIHLGVDRKQADLGETLREIKEQLRQIPNRGIGYGLLRYLNKDPRIAEHMRALPEAQVSFNYLGQIGQSLEETWFRSAAESHGPDRSLRGRRRYLIEIDGGVIDGRLQFSWTYSENLHRRRTIEALAQSFAEFLRAIITHSEFADVMKWFTPWDAKEFGWDEDDLTDILDEIKKIDPSKW